jgi:hypothetical protein
VNVTLTNRGWISGEVSPLAAVKDLLLKVTEGANGGPVSYDATTGTFNVSEVGGTGTTWTVTASSPGYTTNTTTVTVTAGNGSLVNFVMNATGTPVCTVNCNPVCTVNCGPGNTNNATPSSGLSTTDLAIIIAVIVLVAIVALALVMRRRGGSSGDTTNPPEQPPQAIYDESSPSDLPKLQPDGSMGPGNSP